MSKYFTAILMLISVYIIPLIGRLSTLWDIRIFVLIIVSLVVILSQPKLSIEDARENKKTDKNSVLVISIAGAFCQIITILDWGYLQGFSSSFFKKEIITYIGFALMIAGLSFRLWSIRTLGDFFTGSVQLKNDHKIIRKGPYRFLRHPSYTGSFITFLGSSLFLNSILGFVVTGIVMMSAYYIRITLEESVLKEAFGDEYYLYHKSTSRMFPLIW